MRPDRAALIAELTLSLPGDGTDVFRLSLTEEHRIELSVRELVVSNLIDSCIGRINQRTLAFEGIAWGWKWWDEDGSIGAREVATREVARRILGEVARRILGEVERLRGACADLSDQMFIGGHFGLHGDKYQRYLLAKLAKETRVEKFLWILKKVDVKRSFIASIVESIVEMRGGEIARVVKNLRAASEIVG